MKMNDEDWAETEVLFVPSRSSDQRGWKIRYTISRFLFAEGPSATVEAGLQIFKMLSGDREIEPREDGELFVRARKSNGVA